MKARHEIDGTVTLTLNDGRRFTIAEDDDGTFTVSGDDADLLIQPVSPSCIRIDTPLD